MGAACRTQPVGGRLSTPRHIEAYKRGEVNDRTGAGVLTPEHIEAVKRGADDPIWTDFRPTRSARSISSRKPATSRRRPGPPVVGMPEKVLLELIFFMGTYAMLAWVFNATGIRPRTGSAISPRSCYAG